MAEVPKQFLPYLFKKGWKGGPGRKKGKTLKEFARQYLEKISDNEKIEFLNSIDPDIVWRMAEGNPHQTEDITSGGLPLPLLAGKSNDSNNGNTKTSVDEEENP